MKKVVLVIGVVDNIMFFENNDWFGVFRRVDVFEVMNVWGVVFGRKVVVIGVFLEEIIVELECWGIEYIIVLNVKCVEGEDRIECVIDENGNVYEVDVLIMVDGRILDINLII